MALFKIYRGNETNLPSTMNDGWAYFCTDSGNFYIDWDNEGILTRTQINANYASNLRYLDGNEYVEIDATTLIQGFTNMWTKLTDLESSSVKSVNGITADQSGNVEIVIPEQIQADWTQTDETSPDFIKNKPDEDDAFLVAIETGLIESVATASGEFLTDKNNTVIVL